MKTEAEVISVIVPVYNAEKYLRQCIDSIVNQTYRNLEIILIDDGSRDNSGKICDAYAETDNRIRVIHKQNGGQATARNAALEIAAGDYIGFVDADDWIAPNMFELLLSEMNNTNADIVACGRYVVDEETEKEIEFFCHDDAYVISTEEAIKRFLTWDNLDGASCDKLFKRKIIDGMRYPAGYICEDLPFVYNAIKRSQKICLIGEPLYYYRQVANSTSHSSYTERTKGLVLYSKEIKNDVCKEYNTLSEEAEYYYLKSLFHFLERYYLENPFGRAPFKYGVSEYKNRYIDNKTRIKVLLMKMKLFIPIKKLKEGLDVRWKR